MHIYFVVNDHSAPLAEFMYSLHEEKKNNNFFFACLYRMVLNCLLRINLHSMKERERKIK